MEGQRFSKNGIESSILTLIMLDIYINYSPHQFLSHYIARFHLLAYTVKPVQYGHSKIDKTKILMTNGSLMKVKSIAECSP